MASAGAGAALRRRNHIADIKTIPSYLLAQMQLLSAQLAGSQHAERAARIVNQIITTFRRAIRDCTDREDRAQNRKNLGSGGPGDLLLVHLRF